MTGIIKTINGQKKIVPLTADAGSGAPVGTIIALYKKSNPANYLYLDGRDTTGTPDELQTKHPLLYAYLGNTNVLPDFREFALVGAEENTTDVYNASTNPTGTIHEHDIYTEGEAKDDQIQDHKHKVNIRNGSGTPGGDPNVFNGSSSAGISGSNTGTALDPSSSYAVRKGTVTRGKRKAVYFYIKATSGLTEGQQDDVANLMNEQRSYSTSEINTGKKWIDGKTIYRKTFYPTTQNLVINQWGFCGFANTIMSNVDSLIFATAHAIAYGRLCYYTTILVRPDLGFYSEAINIDAGSAITIEYTKITE